MISIMHIPEEQMNTIVMLQDGNKKFKMQIEISLMDKISLIMYLYHKRKDSNKHLLNLKIILKKIEEFLMVKQSVEKNNMNNSYQILLKSMKLLEL
jgi:hypothetical protein